MLSVASPRPVWRAALRSLRELTRLAVAALALTVGLGGATAAPAGAHPGAPPQLSASALATGSGALRPDVAPAVSAGVDASAAERPAPATHRPVRRGGSAPVAAGTATTPVEAVTPADPGGRTPGRRGPPLA
ncbi:hypothetical protein [Micromonospora costi]|uniref:hypothetical protein n=1 Tax=Micromonospora costi TaxID=1530042 RepID=UPI0011C4736F|nr:hypothetical protein [Micromonospora costi]